MKLFFKRLTGYTAIGLLLVTSYLIISHFWDQGGYPTQQVGTLSFATQPRASNYVAGEVQPFLGPLWFWRAFQYSILSVCWGAVGVLVMASMRFLLLPFINGRERIYADPDTGLYPVLRKRHGNVISRLMGRGVSWHEIDMNKSPEPYRYTHINGTMQIEQDGPTSPEQYQLARGIIAAQATVARASGGSKMSVAEARYHSGEFDERAAAARIKREQLENKLSMSAQTPDEDKKTLTEVYSIYDALEYTKQHPGKIIVGQQQGGLQELIVADLNTDPFWLVVGKSMSGKTTTTAFNLVLGSMLSGYGVVIFEPNAKSDWKAFAGHANYHKVNADNIIQHMKMLYDEYVRRGEIMEKYNLGQWYERRDLLPPYVVVFEELGRMREDLKLDPNAGRSKRNLKAFDNYLMLMLKAAANTGLRIIGVDQYPSSYPTATRSSFRSLAYYLGSGSNGAVVGSHKNHRLRGTRMFDTGETDTDDKPIFYQGWHIEPILDDLLSDMPLHSWPEAFNHSDCAKFASANHRHSTDLEDDVDVDEDDVDLEDDVEDGLYQEEDALYNYQESSGNMGYDPAMPPESINAGIDEYRRTGKWDAFAIAFFECYPDARQVDLRLAMSAHGGNSDPDKMKGTGFLMYHAYSQYGDRSYPKVAQYLERKENEQDDHIATENGAQDRPAQNEAQAGRQAHPVRQ